MIPTRLAESNPWTDWVMGKYPTDARLDRDSFLINSFMTGGEIVGGLQSQLAVFVPYLSSEIMHRKVGQVRVIMGLFRVCFRVSPSGYRQSRQVSRVSSK